MNGGYDDEGNALTKDTLMNAVDMGRTTIGEMGAFGLEAALADDVTKSGSGAVKSSGIWLFVKGLLPTWLTSTYTEPATTASVTAAVKRITTIEGKESGWDGKQAALVSGSNIKTVNGISILGSGDIEVGGAVESVNKLTGAVTLTGDNVKVGTATDAKTLNARIAEVEGEISTAVTTHNAATDAHSALFDKKVDKSGTDRLMTEVEGTKLAGIAAGATKVTVTEGDAGNTITAPNAEGEDVPTFVPNKDTSLSVSGAYADAKVTGEKLALRATVASLGNGVFRIADEAVDTTTTEVLY